MYIVSRSGKLLKGHKTVLNFLVLQATLDEEHILIIGGCGGPNQVNMSLVSLPHLALQQTVF